MGGMSGGSSGPPPGPGRKRGAIALQVKLACASLDAVKARYPELRHRLFPLKLKQPLPLDTLVRLEARLNTGAPCFNALAVVERATAEGPEPATLTLVIVAMDEPGRELVAWMGGKPPKSLRPTAAPAPAGPPPALGPPAQLGPLPTFAPAPPAAVPEKAPEPPAEAPPAAPQAAEPPAPPPVDWDTAFPTSTATVPEAQAPASWADAPPASAGWDAPASAPPASE